MTKKRSIRDIKEDIALHRYCLDLLEIELDEVQDPSDCNTTAIGYQVDGEDEDIDIPEI